MPTAAIQQYGELYRIYSSICQQKIANISSLHSSCCFIVVVDDHALIIWIGKLASKADQAVAWHLAVSNNFNNQLMCEKEMCNICKIQEGQEYRNSKGFNDFLKYLGTCKKDYMGSSVDRYLKPVEPNSRTSVYILEKISRVTRIPSNGNEYHLRLHSASSSSETNTTDKNEKIDFPSCLTSSSMCAIFVHDDIQWDSIWVGSEVQSEEITLGINSLKSEYNSDKSNIKVVKEDEEGIFFTSYFNDDHPFRLRNRLSNLRVKRRASVKLSYFLQCCAPYLFNNVNPNDYVVDANQLVNSVDSKSKNSNHSNNSADPSHTSESEIELFISGGTCFASDAFVKLSSSELDTSTAEHIQQEYNCGNFAIIVGYQIELIGADGSRDIAVVTDSYTSQSNVTKFSVLLGQHTPEALVSLNKMLLNSCTSENMSPETSDSYNFTVNRFVLNTAPCY
jgi:hypothetical protein